jgi:hypothetical protein
MATQPKKQEKTNDTTTPAPAVEITQSRVKKITSKLFKSIALGKENGVKIGGVIRMTKTKPSVLDSSKTFVAFYGDFRLTGKIDGKDVLFISTELILPQYPEGVLESAFVSAHEAAGDGVAPQVTFAILLYREKDDSPKNARGFQWALDEIRPISPVSLANDPILRLMS